MRTHYRFGHEWQVQARSDAVLELLQDVPGYEHWWPGVRVLSDVSTAHRRAAVLEVRAPIGYRIRVTITETSADRGELRVSLSGDMDGWAAWRVQPIAGGTRVTYSQEVEAKARLLRLLSPVLHHRLAAQHSKVMAAAAQGMRTAMVDKI